MHSAGIRCLNDLLLSSSSESGRRRSSLWRHTMVLHLILWRYGLFMGACPLDTFSRRCLVEALLTCRASSMVSARDMSCRESTIRRHRGRRSHFTVRRTAFVSADADSDAGERCERDHVRAPDMPGVPRTHGFGRHRSRHCTVLTLVPLCMSEQMGG